MTGNTHSEDDEFNIPPPSSSENISEKDIATDNPDNLMPDTNKENMEVHHHPQMEKNHSKNIY